MSINLPAWVSVTIHIYPLIHQNSINLPRNPKIFPLIYLGIYKYPLIYMVIHKYPLIYLGIHKYLLIYLGIHKYSLKLVLSCGHNHRLQHRVSNTIEGRLNKQKSSTYKHVPINMGILLQVLLNNNGIKPCHKLKFLIPISLDLMMKTF